MSVWLTSGINLALEPEWVYIRVGFYSIFYDNSRISKQTKIYHKSVVFNVAYQQRIRIVFLFNSKM